MKKSTRIVKRILALFLVALMSIENFAAVVSDNDGSAFITKAEFDSLKNNFQNQIDQYNTSIDSKIDGAIASYLSGIKTERVRRLNNLMGNNIIYFLNNISLISTTIPNSVLINYNLSVMHVDEANKYGSSHYGSRSLGTNTGKYNVYESIDGYNFFRGNAQNIKCYSAYTYGGAFVRVDLAASGNPHKIAINSDTGSYIRNISSDVRSTKGCNGSQVKTYGSAVNTTALFQTKLSSNQAEYVTFSRIDTLEQGSLTNDYGNNQYKQTANGTSYDMIDWANFTYNATNTTYTVGADTLDAAPNSYTGNVISHIRFSGTYVTFKPKTKSRKMSDLYNYQIKKVTQSNIPLYGGVPLCTVDAKGKLKIKFKLRSSVPSSDEIRFYISDSIFSNTTPTQHIKYSYVLPEVIEDGKPKEGTINIGEYLRTDDSVEVEITLDCEKDKTYYYKLDSSNNSSSIWADISEINFETE